MKGTIISSGSGGAIVPEVRYIQGPAGKDGKDGADGYTPVKGTDYSDGEDGVSPAVSVYTITGGTRVSITDANGTKTFDVMNGKDGTAGSGSGDMLASMYDPQGKRSDIFAYVDEKTKDIDVDVTADEVTFADGETFQQKYDSGELTGPAGKDGADGIPGADGYTPVKGVDYFDGQPGKDGEDGVGIQSVVQTTTSTADGGTNIITVTKTDGSTSTFSVKNGSKGSDGAAGKDGEAGADGKDATINGVNALTLTGNGGVSASQSGSTLNLAVSGTFAGQAAAASSAQTPGTSLLRNSKLLDATTFDAVSDWSAHLTNGEIAWRYE